MNDCLFCKIIAGEIPSKKVYEDELCYAFYDIAPLAKTHFLVIPKQHLASAAEVTEENAALIGHIYAVIARPGNGFCRWLPCRDELRPARGADGASSALPCPQRPAAGFV